MGGGLTMAWLKFDTSTPEKPEVFSITVAMGWDDPDLTVGKLLKVWRWFDQHTDGGNAPRVTVALLDRVIGVTGFAEAMANVGWLIVTEDGLTLPNFDRHNGETAKSRADTAKRVANHRIKKGGDVTSKAGQSRANIPRPIRAFVFERDRATCVYCGRKEGEYVPPELASDAYMCLDHVIPESRDGSDDPSNLVCACSACNRFKSDRTPDECGLTWPVDKDGKRLGNTKRVTSPLPTALPREEKEKNSSVTDVTDADGVKTAEQLTKDELWHAGKSLLSQAGMPMYQCGSFVGKLVKDYGDAVVIDAVRAAVVARPVDPAEYLKATCMRSKGERSTPNRQEAIEQRNQAAVDVWLSEGQGAIHA